MPEGPGVQGYVPNKHTKKGPATYKAAKGGVGKGSFGNRGQKAAKSSHIHSVDKKVKRISNKVMKFKSKEPGNPAPGTRGMEYHG